MVTGGKEGLWGGEGCNAVSWQHSAKTESVQHPEGLDTSPKLTLTCNWKPT